MRGIVSCMLLSVCLASPAAAVQTNAPAPDRPTGARAETVADGLVRPWGMRFLPDGRIIVTERPGRIRIVARDGTLSRPLPGAPKVEARGQGGMLDIALDPDFKSNNRVYIAFTERRGTAGKNGTSIARARLILETGSNRLENLEIIFRQKPDYAGGYHFGSRLVFAPDGKLFVTLGERNAKDPAQDLGTHLGKVIRINPDGTAPADNPFVDDNTAADAIWSYGHRNPQAAALHPKTHALWIVDHGAMGGDEINIPHAGKNYGWPVITYGRDYSGAKIGVGTAKAGMEQPVYYWDPSIAPSGMAFYSADRFSEWSGNLFVGALKYRSLYRLILKGNMVVGEERLLRRIGQRIRDVRQGPDGAIYVLTDSSNGRIIRVTPADRS